MWNFGDSDSDFDCIQASSENCPIFVKSSQSVEIQYRMAVALR